MARKDVQNEAHRHGQTEVHPHRAQRWSIWIDDQSHAQEEPFDALRRVWRRERTWDEIRCGRGRGAKRDMTRSAREPSFHDLHIRIDLNLSRAFNHHHPSASCRVRIKRQLSGILDSYANLSKGRRIKSARTVNATVRVPRHIPGACPAHTEPDPRWASWNMYATIIS